MNRTTTYRIQYLDRLRVLSVLLVVLTHIVERCPVASPGEGGSRAFVMLDMALLTCNALFILQSGALLLRGYAENTEGGRPDNILAGPGMARPARESLGAFYRRHLARLLIPWLIYYLIYLVAHEGWRALAPQKWPELIRHLVLNDLGYTPHFWLLYVILVCYLVTPLLRRLMNGHTGRWLAAVTVAGIVLLAVIDSALLPFVQNQALPTAQLFEGSQAAIEVKQGSPAGWMAAAAVVEYTGWIAVFMAGAYCATEHAKKHVRRIAAASLAAAAILIAMTLRCPAGQLDAIYSLRAVNLLLAMGTFMAVRLWTKEGSAEKTLSTAWAMQGRTDASRQSSETQDIVETGSDQKEQSARRPGLLVRYSYPILLIHWGILSLILKVLPLSNEDADVLTSAESAGATVLPAPGSAGMLALRAAVVFALTVALSLAAGFAIEQVRTRLWAGIQQIMKKRPAMM